MKRRPFHFPLVAAIVFIAGCSGGGAHGGSSDIPPSSPSSGAGSASGFTYNATEMQGATLIGPAKLASVSVDLVPQLQNAGGLLAYAAQVNDPKNGAYRRFITPQQIGAAYGASQSTYAAATLYFQSQGLSVAGWPQRLLLHVSGPQSKMETALNTHFGWYHSATGTFVAPMQTPSPPASAHVTGAVGIVMKPYLFTDNASIKPSVGATNGLLYGYSPEQIATAFDYNGAYQAGYTGAGITTGVIGTAGLSAADVPAYRSTFKIGGSGTVTEVSATDANMAGNSASGFASPLPVTPGCQGSPYEPTATCNPEDAETQIDTEQLSSLAPNSNVRYYLAYNPNDGCGVVNSPCPPGAGVPMQGLFEFDAEIETAIAENKADALSLSFGGPEAGSVGQEFNASGYGLAPLEFAALASEGVAVFVSSGDSGAEACANYALPNPNGLCVSYPSTDVNVVSVGGTNTPLNTAGQFVGALTGWGDQTSGGEGGSGGGVSQYFKQPVSQQNAAGVTGSMRNVPDVSLNGDDHTGVAVEMYADPTLSSSPFWSSYGGTSVAAPEMAAMWALVLQACKQTASCATAGGAAPYRLGNPNGYFYKIYANSTEYSNVFYDVLYGSNAQVPTCTSLPCPTPDPGYSAGAGYDLVTGIGAPFARALIKAVVGV